VKSQGSKQKVELKVNKIVLVSSPLFVIKQPLTILLYFIISIFFPSFLQDFINFNIFFSLFEYIIQHNVAHTSTIQYIKFIAAICFVLFRILNIFVSTKYQCGQSVSPGYVIRSLLWFFGTAYENIVFKLFKFYSLFINHCLVVY